MTKTLARLAGLTAATAVVVPLLAAAPASADDASANTGGGWLTSQLVDGLMPSQFAGFSDYGLSIDTAFALQATDQRGKTVRTIRNAVADDIETYAGAYSFPDGDDTVGATPSNATAKATVFALATGGDASDFGGLDLAGQLEDVVTDGRLSDNPTRNGEPDPDGDDYANVIGQAFAVHALDELGSDEDQEALDYLARQQCADGSFRLALADDDQDAVAANCADNDADVDATALAVLQLAQVGDTTATTVVDAAASWLKTVQGKNGAFGGAGPTAADNANSTGLAGWALSEARRAKPARKAARWVADLQLVNAKGCRAFDAEDLGAIAYDRPALIAAAGKKGITKDTADQFRRATAQALPVLELAPKATATGPC